MEALMPRRLLYEVACVSCLVYFRGSPGPAFIGSAGLRKVWLRHALGTSSGSVLLLLFGPLWVFLGLFGSTWVE